MEKVISLNDSIYNLTKKHDNIVKIMESLGFDGITNPKTLNTVGRIMSLKTGAKLKKIEFETIICEFEKNGFTVKE
jgi:hypothetical protein